MTGQPLTADRPEAWEIGPMYRRLAEELRSNGAEPVIEAIAIPSPLAGTTTHFGKIQTDLERLELDLIDRVSRDYGCLSPSQLSGLTRAAGTPWAIVFNSGAGQFREISHTLIRDQFVHFAQRVRERHNHY